jgi:hypothetical protein
MRFFLKAKSGRLDRFRKGGVGGVSRLFLKFRFRKFKSE